MAHADDRQFLRDLLDQARSVAFRLHAIGQINDRVADRLGGFWQANTRNFETILETSTDALEALHRCLATNHFSHMTHYTDRSRIEANVRWMEDFLARRGVDLAAYPPEITESPFSLTGTFVNSADRTLSPDFLRYLEMWSTIDREIPLPSNGRLLELGGGYGCQARVAKLIHPGLSLTLVDLPLSLIFAYIFIALNFPGAKMLFVTHANMLDALSDSEHYDFIFVPTVFAEHLKSFRYDLFVNTNSLTELSNDTAAFWFAFLQDRDRADWIYLDNRFLNFPVAEFRSKENGCFFHLDSKWETRYWEFDDPATHAPYLMTEHPRNLRMIGRRGGVGDGIAASDALLAQVQIEDWYRASRTGTDSDPDFDLSRFIALYPRTYGPHRVDGGRSGTLFKLWEAARLDPTRAKLKTLRAYIKFLTQTPTTGSIEFEEAGYLDGLIAAT